MILGVWYIGNIDVRRLDLIGKYNALTFFSSLLRKEVMENLPLKSIFIN